MTTHLTAFDARHLPIKPGVFFRRTSDGSLFYTANPSAYQAALVSGELTLASLTFIEDTTIKTAEMNLAAGEVRFNPCWIASLEPRQRAFVIHHQYRQWAAYEASTRSAAQ